MYSIVYHSKTRLFVTDFDECREEIDDCHADAECKNTLTYFECYCQEGFLGEGKNCTGTCQETGNEPEALTMFQVFVYTSV